MPKYHINEKGETRLCSATLVLCPFGSFDSHFDTVEEGQEFYEDFAEKILDSKATTKFFFVSTQEKHAFTKADCPHLAKAFNKKFGLPICYLGDRQSSDGEIDDREWSHFVNRLPDGRYIDAEGIWTEKDLLKHWQIDELGRGWMPSSINDCELTDLRKMGVQSPMFPEMKPAKFVTKVKKYINSFEIFE